MKPFVMGALVLVSVLISATFLPAQNPTGQKVPGLVEGVVPFSPETPARIQVPDTIRIRIVADADSVVAEPSTVTVLPGQVVTWICDLGEWTVRFKDGQPFGEAAVGDGIRGNQGQRRGQAVRRNAEPGSYKYDIMVRVQGGPNLTADPEVVVGPGDGGGR